ncbi:2Fe-2S iron-sulfur cluster-binding protein [Leifsonia xyli]|uniref:2Fe-2S iron-sulfur cluster-binding protein n=1 Tax=Leifsonia xyli TaxID=1575 RepID=UPI003D67A99A
MLLTAGIGITPALAIAGDLARRGDTSRVVKGIHVARTVASIPHLDELRASFATLGGDLRVYLTADHPMPGFHTGRPGDADLRALIEDPASVTVVICGPTAFEADMRAALSRLGVSGKQIRSDPFYSPRTDLGDRREPPRPGPFMIAFDDGADRVDAEWTVAAGSILDVADAAGLTLPAACRAGACGTCAMRVSDEVAYLVDPISPPEPGTALICCAVPISDVRVRSLAAAEDQ